uniref:Uncharacterized protein n=1 Tax=Lutzomyia longipalpis TaxID=7200 RepID=A0A7G3B795_LUTLO
MASVKLTQITVRRRLPGSTWLAILLLVIDAAAAFYWLPVVSLYIVVVIVLHAYFYFNKNHFINARSRIKISGLRRNIPYDDLRENLIRQNNLQFNEDIRVLSIHETQRRIYFDAILEVSLQLKRKLLNMDRVKIGSDLCYVNYIEKSFWDKLTNVAIGMLLLVLIYIKLGSNSEITQEFVNGPSEEI